YRAHRRRPEYRRSIFASTLDLRRRVTGQGDNKFGEDVWLGGDLYPAAVLFHDDVVADRKTKPGPFAHRLCREEGIEDLLFQLLRDAGTIVANPDLHLVTQASRTRRQGRLEIITGRFLALARRVEAIRDQIEQHPRDLLRIEVDRSGVRVKIALERNVET